jgi:hypothetical protein
MQSFSLCALAAWLFMVSFALLSTACGSGSNAPATTVQASIAAVPVVPASDSTPEFIPEPIPAPLPEPIPPPVPPS